MQDIQLLKDQDRWLANVILEDGKNAPMSLSEELSDAEADALNRATREERKQELLPKLLGPTLLEEEGLI